MGDVDTRKVRALERASTVYLETFTRNLSIVIGAFERIPLEIDHQSRNAFTHVARAVSASDVVTVDREIERAVNHIDRANRDCLKAGIIAGRERLDDLVADISFHRGRLTPAQATELKYIDRLRREAYVAETSGEGASVDRLELILRHIMDLTDLLKVEFHEAGTRKTWLMRRLQRWYHPVVTVSFTLLGTVIGTVIGVLSRPHIEPYIGSLLGP